MTTQSGNYYRKLRKERGLPEYTATGRLHKRAADRRRVLWHQDFATQEKLRLGCADCGYNAHPAALHFDHLPGSDKRAEISRMLKRDIPREELVAEMNKCEVVCANCHAVRTATRLQAANAARVG